MLRLVRLATPLLLLGTVSMPGQAQAPAGLAASALANPAFTWIPRSAPGFRVYFLADSYPALHQDSLLARLALRRDLFFVESREQMTALIGGRATGFAHPSARAVFLMTHPAWRTGVARGTASIGPTRSDGAGRH